MPVDLLRFRTKETEWKDRTTFAALLSIWFVNILHLHIGFQSVRLLSVSETPCFSCAHSEFTSLIAKQCQFPCGNHLAKNAPVTSRLSRRHFRWLQPLSPVGKSTCDKTQQFHTIPTHKLRLAAKGQVARKKKDKNYRQSCSVSENRETPTTNHWCPRSRPQHGHNTMTFDPFFCPRPASASLHHSRSARSDWRRLSLANPQRTEHCD